MNVAAPASRNAPCPCGSGRRYKECHGALAAAADAGGPDVRRRVEEHVAAGRLDDAAALIAANEAAVHADPALRLLAARVALGQGQRTLAERHCRALTALDPRNVAAWNLLGEALRVDDPAGARVAWETAAAADPGDGEARFHLGNLARESGDAKAAVAHYVAALDAAPDNASVLNNLGLAQEASGDRDAAQASYRRALALESDNADALGNLANVLFAQGIYAETEVLYRRLFALRPQLPTYVVMQRGHALRELGWLAEAEACFRSALVQEPDKTEILVNLAQVVYEQQRFDEALPIFEEIVVREPDDGAARAMVCATKLQVCDWDGIEAKLCDLADFLAAHPDGGDATPSPGILLTMPIDAPVQQRVARAWSRKSIIPDAQPPVLEPLRPGERLRIGFVSSDLRGHAFTYLALEHFENLRGGRLETFAYSIHPDAEGALGVRIRNAFDHYVNVTEEPAPAIAERIRADRIGVLFDCNGHTKFARLEVFARRPAPVQVSYLGYAGTMGAPWVDYIVVDPFGLPPQAERWFDEKPLRMPHASFPSDTKRAPMGPPPSRSTQGLPDDAFVFSCHNNTSKIMPDVFAIWMRLLARVPGSVLWLYAPVAKVADNLRREAAARGVDPQRLVFAPRADLAPYMARHALADLFLDTFPYGAHTTANDALLMGVPVLTCAGERLVSRIPGSQLHALGLPELVTDSLEAYEAMALELARDRSLLRSLRTRIAANRATHPLFDMRRYSADFEALTLRAWDDYLATRR